LPSPDNSQFEASAQLKSELPASLPPSDPLAPSPLPPVAPASEPAENPVWSGWDVLQIAGIGFLALIVFQFFTVVAAHRYAYPHLSWGDVAQKPVLALIAEFAAYIGIAIFMVALVEGKYHVRFWQAIGWNWPRSQWRLLAIGVVTLFGLNLLERFLPFPKSVPFDQFLAHPRDAYLTSLFAVSFGPLMEELFFRGFLYPVLARWLGLVGGIVLTALPFGLIHAVQYGNAWSAVLVIFIVGLVLTVVRAVTKSVAASFLVHVGYNGALMVLAAVATDGFRHMDKVAVLLPYSL
jgi:membrane protease YdiL (CAAX protease family)